MESINKVRGIKGIVLVSLLFIGFIVGIASKVEVSGMNCKDSSLLIFEWRK